MPERFFVNDRLRSLAADARTILFHPHAARTGGRTVRTQLLSPALGAERVYCRQHVPNWKAWRDLTDADLEGFRAYTDLRDFEVLPLKRPVACIAVVRHPVYRAASLYGFIRGNKDHQHHDEAQRYPLEEFYRLVATGHPKYFSNVQTRRICGEGDARLALDFLRGKYIAAGFTNHLADFALGLCDLFRWPAIGLERVAADEERYASLSRNFHDMVIADNAEDMALWEAVVSGRAFAGTPAAPVIKRVGYLSGIVPALRKFRARLALTAAGRRRKLESQLTQEQRKRLRRFERARARLARAKEAMAAAAPGTHVCNIFGWPQKGAARFQCPSCKTVPRQRSFPALWEKVLSPLFAGRRTGAALIFPTGGVERALMEPFFVDVVIPSLHNNYRALPEKADIRKLDNYADASFDFVQAGGEMHDIDRPVDGLLSVRRVLRPGGMFLFYLRNREAIPSAQLGGGGWSYEVHETGDPLTGETACWLLCRLDVRAAGSE